MNTRTIFFLSILYLFIFSVFVLIVNWQITSNIDKNNELIEANIKKTINEQLKLKYAPLIDIEANNKLKKRITLSKDQIDLINKNIAINSAKVDDAIRNSNDEIGRDINRISIDVTILLAFVGFLGVIVPIILNISSTSDLTRRVNRFETNLISFNGRLNEADNNITQIEQELQTSLEVARNASFTAQEAVKNIDELSTIVHLLDNLSKLKMLDFLRFKHGAIRDKYMKTYFSKLSNSFISCKEKKINPLTNVIFKEACLDLMITIYQLFILMQANPLLLDRFKDLINLLNTLINTDDIHLETAFQNVIDKLNEISN